MTPPSSASIALIDPKSPSNVGAVMRAAGCYGVTQVRYTGVRFARAAKYHTDTHNISSQIPLLHVDDILSPFAHPMSIVCVELAEGASLLPHFEHPDNALYVFGPEDGSIPQAVINRADSVVYIPTEGCMNLAASVNVVLYDRLSKMAPSGYKDNCIIRSRDTNNRLVVQE